MIRTNFFHEFNKPHIIGNRPLKKKSVKIFLNNILSDKISADKIFGSKSKFRQFFTNP